MAILSGSAGTTSIHPRWRDVQLYLTVDEVQLRRATKINSVLSFGIIRAKRVVNYHSRAEMALARCSWQGWRRCQKKLLHRNVTMTPLFRTWRSWIVGFWLAAAIGASDPQDLSAQSPAPTCGKRVGDQLWLVSTRHLGCMGIVDDLPDYRVRYFAQNAWHMADAQSLLAQDDPERTTVVYVHGNRSGIGDAVASGWEVYQALVEPLAPEQHVRLIIWSWPSDQVRGPVRDVRTKAARTSVESYYLAKLLVHIRPEVPTSLLGYSFGARISLGALHLAGGGELDGRFVDRIDAPRPKAFRVAMIAAGADDDSLLPDDRFPVAALSAEQIFNTFNPCDPALKRYRFVDRCEKPAAMGYSGIYGMPMLGTAATQIRQMNVSGIVGKSHDERRYLHSETIMQEVRQVVLFQ
jgi:hypothetical protein